MKVSRIVEAVLFASETPLRADEIARADESLDEDRVEGAIQELRAEYDEEDRAFHVTELGEGYQILTRSEFSTYLERFDTVPKSSRLSGPALETLAIVAYRQPITRVEVEYIRGVSSSGVLRTLEDRDLIEVVGRDEGLGRPYLYGTTETFLNHFGFRSLEELPRPDELPVVLRDPQPLDDDEESDAEESKGEGGEDEEGTGDGDVEPTAGPRGSGASAAEDGAGPADEEPSVEEAVSRVLESAPSVDDAEPPPVDAEHSAAEAEQPPPNGEQAPANDPPSPGGEDTSAEVPSADDGPRGGG